MWVIVFNDWAGWIILLSRKVAKNSLLFQLPESSPSSPTLSVDLSVRQLERCLEGPIGKTMIKPYWRFLFICCSRYSNSKCVQLCPLYLSQIVQNARDRESFCHKLCDSVHVNESTPQWLQVGKESGLIISSSCMIQPRTNTRAMKQTCTKKKLQQSAQSVRENCLPSFIAWLGVSEALL